MNSSNNLICYYYLISSNCCCNGNSLLQQPPCLCKLDQTSPHARRQSHSFTVVSWPSPDEARQRYCFASGVLLVQALTHHYITLHNLLATGETSNAVSVVSARGGCVTTRPGAEDTGVSAQHAVTVVGRFVWYREEAAAAKAAIMTTARTFWKRCRVLFSSVRSP